MSFKSTTQEEYFNTLHPELADKYREGFAKSAAEGISNSRSKIKAESDIIFRTGLNATYEKEASEVTLVLPPRLDFQKEDFNISKVAGMMIYDTSPEGIEDFVKNFLTNELSFFPDKLTFQVEINPEQVYHNDKQIYDPQIDNATGAVLIPYANTVVQLPFIIRDRQLLPFDAIQLGTENAVYTRENIRNILFNLKDNYGNQNSQGAGAIPKDAQTYVESGKRTNELTDVGFMGSVLQVQNQTGSGQGQYAYASVVEELLEKTAGIKEVKLDYAKLREDIARDANIAAEKLASIEFNDPEALEKQAAIEDLKSTVLVDVRVLPSGAPFNYVSKEGTLNETLLSPEPARVYKSLLTFSGMPTNRVMIISGARKFKVLKDGERFLFSAKKDMAPDEQVAPFEFQYTNIEGLNVGRMYVADVGGMLTVPFMITGSRLGSDKQLLLKRAFTVRDLDGQEGTLIEVPGEEDNAMIVMNKKTFLNKIAALENPKNLIYYSGIVRKGTSVIGMTKHVKYIELTGPIQGEIRSPKELGMLASRDFVKLANLTNKVTVTVADREAETYNVEILWNDSRTHQDQKRDFTAVPEGKVKGILKTIGFDYSEVGTLAFKAKNEGTATAEIRLGQHTPWMAKNDFTGTANSGGRFNRDSGRSNFNRDKGRDFAGSREADSVISNMKDSFFTKSNAAKAVVAVAGGVLGGVAAGAGFDSLRMLKSIASESEALAMKMEKVATGYQSNSFAKLAGLMVVKNRIDNMVIGALEGDEFEGHEVLASLDQIDTYLPEVAYDLITLKVAQAVSSNEVISPNVIGGLLKQLDGLHKYAGYFTKVASIYGADSPVDIALNAAGDSQDKINATAATPQPKVEPLGKSIVGHGAVQQTLQAVGNGYDHIPGAFMLGGIIKRK